MVEDDLYVIRRLVLNAEISNGLCFFCWSQSA
jgi:hypothetical protein